MAGQRAQRVNASLLRNNSAQFRARGGELLAKGIENLFGGLAAGKARADDRKEREGVREEARQERALERADRDKRFNAQMGLSAARLGLERERLEDSRAARLGAVEAQKASDAEAKFAMLKRDKDWVDGAQRFRGVIPGIEQEIERRQGNISRLEKDAMTVAGGILSMARADGGGASPEELKAMSARLGKTDEGLSDFIKQLSSDKKVSVQTRNMITKELQDKRAEIAFKKAELDGLAARGLESRSQRERANKAVAAVKQADSALESAAARQAEGLGLSSTDPLIKSAISEARGMFPGNSQGAAASRKEHVMATIAAKAGVRDDDDDALAPGEAERMIKARGIKEDDPRRPDLLAIKSRKSLRDELQQERTADRIEAGTRESVERRIKEAAKSKDDDLKRAGRDTLSSINDDIGALLDEREEAAKADTEATRKLVRPEPMTDSDWEEILADYSEDDLYEAAAVARKRSTKDRIVTFILKRAQRGR